MINMNKQQLNTPVTGIHPQRTRAPRHQPHTHMRREAMHGNALAPPVRPFTSSRHTRAYSSNFREILLWRGEITKLPMLARFKKVCPRIAQYADNCGAWIACVMMCCFKDMEGCGVSTK